LDEPLRELFAVLGSVRDFDIAIAVWEKTSVPALAGAEVLGRLTAVQATAKLTATVALAKHSVLDDLAESLHKKLPTSTEAKIPSAELAPELVQQAFDAVHRSVHDLKPKSPPEDIHRLRRRIKRLRYMVEFFIAEYGKPAAKFVDAMKDLQDLLGEHQDVLLAVQILGTLPDLPDETRRSVDAAIEELRSAALRLRSRIMKAASKVDGKPWSRLRRRMQSVQQRPEADL
jgi:CHAD domain-containing protein